jgi:hypothetical protein
MKNMIAVTFCSLCLLSIAQARTWTDNLGRKIDAEIVRADADSVTVLAGGREVKIPRSKLSEADQKYCDEWLENLDGGGNDDVDDDADDEEAGEKPKPAQGGPAKGEMEFDGKPLITGGKVNVFNYPYEPAALDAVKRSLKDGETGFRIGIAVPAGFDPNKPQRVFVANTAQNNPQQTLEGNTRMAEFFSKQCAEQGWVCFAFDSNLGRPLHNQDLISAVAKMNQVWPKFNQWKFVCGGFSGGGKAAFWPAAFLLKNGYQMNGLFLANTNEDFSELARKEYRIKKGDYSNVVVFWGSAKWDPIVSTQKGAIMKKSLEGNGMKEVRVEFHDGKHSLDHAQFIEALKWFEAKG